MGAHRFAHPTAVAILSLILAAGGAGAAPTVPRIWDVQPGTAVGDLPEDDFVDPACGTNGGPPGLRLGGFEEFAKCRAEPTGLREIWFRYDDEEEYVARAARDADAVARSNAMVMLGQPVILSLLIDRAGRVAGFRIFTDPHAEAELRENAYTLAYAFKARYGADGWQCEELPPEAGETAIMGTFVKQQCRKASDGRQITVESRHYYKSGQALRDPNSGLSTVNQFESAARMESVRTEALPK
ncbi:MAG TPA: hypothetical protein VIY51_19930 [Xanthobacteraceae bacterium]